MKLPSLFTTIKIQSILEWASFILKWRLTTTSLGKMERMMGFEPTTSTLARLRSTPELHPLGWVSEPELAAGGFIRVRRKKAIFILEFSRPAVLPCLPNCIKVWLINEILSSDGGTNSMLWRHERIAHYPYYAGRPVHRHALS